MRKLNIPPRFGRKPGAFGVAERVGGNEGGLRVARPQAEHLSSLKLECETSYSFLDSDTP